MEDIKEKPTFYSVDDWGRSLYKYKGEKYIELEGELYTVETGEDCMAEPGYPTGIKYVDGKWVK